MTQPLDPLAFLSLAHVLAQQADEAALRTAIDCAYYALFLVAREKTGVRSTRAVHTEVISAVKKRPGYRATADQMDTLRRLRVVADYQLLPDNPTMREWTGNWAKTQALINHILPKLQAW